MKSSIYIAAEKIEIIGYTKRGTKMNINDYVNYPIPEGAMINGKITEPGDIIECLKTLKKANPHLLEEVSLVIDGNSVITKKLPVPNLKRAQYLQLVREDMADTAENYANLIFDYSFLEYKKKLKKEKPPKLGKGGKAAKSAKKSDDAKAAESTALKTNDGTVQSQNSSAIFACATDKLTIESYQNVFDEAKIKLCAISVGLEAVINFVGKQKDLLTKTFVLNIVDGFSMLSIIFEKGNYIFSTRTRLIGDDNEQLLFNILENLSPLIQFNKSQQLSDIQASYYLGLSYDQVAFIAKVSMHTDVKISVLDIYKNAKKGRKVGDACYFAFFGALLDRKNINLIQSYKNVEKYSKERKRGSLLPLFPILLAVAIGAIVGYPLLQTYQLQDDISIIEEYLSDATVVAKSAELDGISQKSDAFANIIKQIEDKQLELDARAAVSRAALDLITKSNNQTISVTEFSFSEAEGIVHVVGNSATQNDSANYVLVLKASDFVDDVYYTGYSFDNAEIPRFNFAVDVVLHTERGATE